MIKSFASMRGSAFALHQRLAVGLILPHSLRDVEEQGLFAGV
jgi:hypothetical protein